MKLISKCILLLFAISSLIYSQWIDQSIKYEGTIYSVHLIDNNTGWICGQGGLIAKTTDGGYTWFNQESGISENLFSIFFVNENIGYAAGWNGTLIKTLDGGITWESQDSGTGKKLESIYFIDENTGWIAADGAVLRTTDGGQNWQYQSFIQLNEIPSIYFTDANNGWMVGDGGKLRKTTDGGVNWIQQSSGTNQFLNSVFFIGTDIGWICGNSGTILKTTDGGTTWAILNSGTTLHLRSIFCASENIGYVVGWDGAMLKTTDGGENWTDISGGNSNHMEAVYFNNENNGVAIGNNGTILKTNNGGIGWSELRVNEVGDLTYFFATQSVSKSSFQASSASNLFTINDAQLQKSTDGGKTWVTISLDNNAIFYAIHFISQSIGIVVGANGTIYRTTDGGQSWTPVNSGLSGDPKSDLHNIHFTSDNTGYIVGSNGTILMTIDGGQSWTLQDTGGADGNLYSVHFPNAGSNVGYAVGTSGTILATNDYGITWSDISLNSPINFDDVFFTDENNGYMVGEHNIYKTTDGGNNWTEQPHYGEAFTSITFTDENNGFVVGKNNAIYQTNDAGNSWTNINSGNEKISKLNTNVKPDLNHIFFIDKNEGWIVGDNSTIYYTENGGEGGFVNVESDSKPNGFMLAQNYPNPFNPSTTIEFSIPIESDVTLEIFNLLGQKVYETIFQSAKEGNHKMQWYGRDNKGFALSSGIYIYTIKAGGFYQTKKMVLLR